VRNDSGVLPRVLLAVCALVVIAWTGVLVRDHYLGESAAATLLYHPNLSDRDFRHNMERLVDARFLNPDSAADLARVEYYLFRGRPRAAARVAESLVRDQPANADAWHLLWRATRVIDPERAEQAAAALKRLNPLATL
jgi:predicted Zn-dependent protease